MSMLNNVKLSVLLVMTFAVMSCTHFDRKVDNVEENVAYADPIMTTTASTLAADLLLSIDDLSQINVLNVGDMTARDIANLGAVSKHNELEYSPLLSGINRELANTSTLTLANLRKSQSITSASIMQIGKLQVPGAEMLRVQLDLSELPPDAELFINNSSQLRLAKWIPTSDSSAWSPIVFGDSITLAIRSQKRIDRINILGLLQIFPLSPDGKLRRRNEVFSNGRWETYVSAEEMGPLVDSTCKKDENTPYRNLPNFVRQIESAVGLLATVTSLPGGAIVSGFCTGTRVASNKDPQGYYMLTANHCFSPGNPPQVNASPSAVAATQVFWDYRTGSCSSSGPVQFSSPQLMGLPNSGGAQLLGARFQSDAVLFRVTPAAGSRVALGWQLGLHFTNDAFVHRVSHPSAFSTGYTHQLIDHIENLSYCESSGLPRAEYFNSGLLEGATKPGSSGSAVVTQNLRVVGQQYGICNWTTNGHTWHIHVDGELSRSWPAFGHYLQ